VTSGVHRPDGLWAPERRRLTVGLVLTITLVAFEALAISTVMPVVSRDLGGLSLYGWVFSAFFLGSLLGIVWSGQAADRHGTGLPFAVGLGLFTVGLVVGGLAPSMEVLVAARVAQGIGAGVIPAVAYTTVGRSYPATLRPRVFAVFSTAWVVPGLLGPAASSFIATHTSWRWVFLALFPFVLLAGAMALPVLERRGSFARDGEMLPDRRPLAVVLTAAVALVLAAVGGRSTPVAILLAAVGGPVALGAFLRLVPAGTARLAPGMPSAIMVRGILTFAFFGTDAYVSLTYTEVRGQPTWVAGVALTLATLLWTAGAWVQQRLVHTVGPRRLVSRGFLVLAAGVAGMLCGIELLPVPLGVAVWSLAGLGMGLSYAPLSVTVLGTAPPGQEGAASASLQLTDVLGVSLGTGLGGAFVALGVAQGWDPGSALYVAFSVCLAVALLGSVAARRLPAALPG
jgi:MFS family permease